MKQHAPIQEIKTQILSIVADAETIESELFLHGLDTSIAQNLIDSGIALAVVLCDPDEITPLMVAAYSWYVQQYESLMRITVGVSSLPMALERTQMVN